MIFLRERIAVVSGKRSSFLKAGTQFQSLTADDLGAAVLRSVLLESEVNQSEIDDVFIGNVGQPPHAANVSRVIALKAGLAESIPAATVHRNCASGMESISTAMNLLWIDKASTVVAGGTESMSNIPFLFRPEMKAFFERLMRSKRVSAKIKTLLSFRLSYLAPVIGLLEGLTDPVCGQIMGVTAENLAKEFMITREEQDAYALHSHQKACSAQESGVFAEETVPVSVLGKVNDIVQADNGPRQDQSLEALAKLRPYFDRHNGTVTVGNACPITDGAAMVILKKESEAKRLGLDVLGYITDYDYAGLEPQRMGLGPVYATHKLFNRLGMSMADIDLIEMNEAFAAQILANLRAFESVDFAKAHLKQDKAVGAINEAMFNVNGGAIALGHPVGTTGTRLIITLLHALRRQNKHRGLATLCVGGGQGASFIVEAS